MRIEKCAEHDGKRLTVYVEDDTVRATDQEAVQALLGVLDAVTARGMNESSGLEGEANG